MLTHLFLRVYSVYLSYFILAVPIWAVFVGSHNTRALVPHYLYQYWIWYLLVHANTRALVSHYLYQYWIWYMLLHANTRTLVPHYLYQYWMILAFCFVTIFAHRKLNFDDNSNTAFILLLFQTVLLGRQLKCRFFFCVLTLFFARKALGRSFGLLWCLHGFTYILFVCIFLYWD